MSVIDEVIEGERWFITKEVQDEVYQLRGERNLYKRLYQEAVWDIQSQQERVQKLTDAIDEFWDTEEKQDDDYCYDCDCRPDGSGCA